MTAAPAVNCPKARSGRASGQRRYRTSDGQSLIGYSSIIVGSLCFGAVLLGYLRGSEIVPMFLVSSSGLVVATAWCSREKMFQTATIFGALAGFNLSYALLQLGVTNNWYSIPIQNLTNVLTFYSLVWIAIFILLSFAVFNASVAAFALFVCFEASLGLVVAANFSGSINILRWSAVPIGVVILISAGFIVHVMQGWHRRDVSEAARATVSRAIPVGDGSTSGPITNRRQHAHTIGPA